MAFPSGTYLSELVGRVRDEFDALYAQLEGWLRTEHKSNGSHGAITADSLTATGDISGEDGTFTGSGSFAGNLSVTGLLTHDGALDANAASTASVTSTTQEWGISGTEMREQVIRVTSVSGLGPTLVGVAAPSTLFPGTVFRVINTTTSSFTIAHLSGGASLTTYRLATPSAKSITIREGHSFTLVYDDTSLYWRVLAQDYEEGTWSIGLTINGSATGITTGGSTAAAFTRNGNVVTAEGRLVLTSNGAGTGAAVITGLPYSAAAFPACVIDCNTGVNLPAAYTVFGVLSGTTIVPVYPTTTTRVQLTDTEITDTADLRLGITYRI